VSTTILAIESSCDETSVAICKDEKILSNIVATQSIHEKYGGVVPELASRAHIQNIVPVAHVALQQANTTLSQINAVAFTQSPGLIGSLLVGTQFAKSIAFALQVPLIAVNHMQAHVIANLIEEEKPSFPFLCLTVSGGHTQIVLATDYLQQEILGETIDDAAGEAFDKIAKLLNLPYPGGPLIDKYAREGKPVFHFAEPQVEGLNFSFSGLKTSVLYFLQDEMQKNPLFIEQHRNDICASVQHTIVQILLKKLKKAVLLTKVKQICIAGGVSANSGLREAFKAMGKKYDWQTFIPPFQYCTDNAGMIALTGYYKFLQNQFSPFNVVPSARG
jgi:N6-L-threonylcarbamoyladenine synthase